MIGERYEHRSHIKTVEMKSRVDGKMRIVTLDLSKYEYYYSSSDDDDGFFVFVVTRSIDLRSVFPECCSHYDDKISEDRDLDTAKMAFAEELLRLQSEFLNE